MPQIKIEPFYNLLHDFTTNLAGAEAVSGALLFSASQTEDFFGQGVIPAGFNSFAASELPFWMADDDDSDHVTRMTIEIMRVSDGVKPKVEDFDTENAGTANIPGTSGGAGGWGANEGERGKVEITVVNDGGVQPGDNFYIRVRRTPGVGGDDATGMLKLLPFLLNYV